MEWLTWYLFFQGGILRGIQDRFWFHKEDNLAYRFFKRYPKFYPFYDGHKSLWQCLWGDKCPAWLRYNPTLILITDDFWHAIKDLEILSYISALCYEKGDWWLMLLYLAVGFGFVLYYHVIGPRIVQLKTIMRALFGPRE